MSYQVIARKYRPQRFSDVVGQEHVAQTLSNAIRQNRIAHAYLFCGPRGTGKTTIARIFAKCLNCNGGPKVDFLDDDPRCREITEGRSLDVLEIDGASNRGIEEIRQLRDTVRYAPATSRFKIYIIDEVHMLTKEAFNALLKTLEEPPAHAKFMFATTEPEKVLPTILSRCQRFDLRRIPSDLIVQHLARIATLESVQITQDALHAIARGADGGMRDAESTLDQLISFCGNSIEETDVLSMFGLVAQSQILELAHTLLANRPGDALRLLEQLARHGKDLGRLLAELLDHFRNLLLHHLAPAELHQSALPESAVKALAEHASLADPAAVSRMLEVLVDYEWRLRDTPSKRILLEIALLKTIDARLATPLDAVLRQLQALRENSTAPCPPPTPGPQLPQPPSPPPDHTRRQSSITPPIRGTDARSEGSLTPSNIQTAEPATPPLPETSAHPARTAAPADLDELWQAVLEGVGRASPFARTYLLQAHPVAFNQQTLTIGFDPQFSDHLDLADTAKNRTLIQTKLKELGHPGAQVKFIQAEHPSPDQVPTSPHPIKTASPAPTPPPAASDPTPAANTTGAPTHRLPPPVDKNDFKSDPLIQKALEIFKAQIVDVRSS
jgi:DNA polymerase-3 subunit gamma/tau